MNRIIHGDARNLLNYVEENSIALIVTSPPYNVEKSYEKEKLKLEDYLDFLKIIWQNCFKVLKENGRICINIADIERNPLIPLHAYIIMQLLDIGFDLYTIVIWDKENSAKLGTAFGSYLTPSKPCFTDIHEYIIIAAKGLSPLKGNGGKMTKEDFFNIRKSIWKFKTETNQVFFNEKKEKITHDAPFPIELPTYCIKFLSFPGDTILDPFVGSGTTCIAAKLLNRKFIGIDKDLQFIKLARDRVNRVPVIKGFE